MPSVTRGKDRRQDVRPGLRVKHRHRIGGTVVERISELLYVRGRPVAVFDWIDLGGIRTPLYVCELDQKRLHPVTGQRGLYHYDAVTADPRFPNMLGDS